MTESDTRTVAGAVAEFIVSLGTERLYTLPGSHIKPIWHALLPAGVRLVDARSEGAAVHMAQAEADLTGRLGIAIVTTGPGVTNAMTAIASANLARSAVLVLSVRVPRPQAGMGALEEIPQAELLRAVCCESREVSAARHVLPSLHAAAHAALGSDGPGGVAYVDFPYDLLREGLPDVWAHPRWFGPVERRPLPPDPRAVASAAQLLRESRRPLLIGGRGLRGAETALSTLLATTGAVYLDTRESRGIAAADAPGSVAAMRARAMGEADLVLTLGRRLDFELAYGSAAVFSAATSFVRVGRTAEELSENRGADLELRSDVASAIEALNAQPVAPANPDTAWREGLIAENAAKVERLRERNAAHPTGDDGRMHPYRLLAELDRVIDPDTIVIADGGDILSYVRVALRTPTYLDLGPFGCLGVGMPFATAASLAYPARRVIAVVGDGAFGFHCIELESAVRHGAKPLIVVANNEAWNIERYDQIVNWGGEIVGTELSGTNYAELARAMGAYGERVDDAAELPGALARGLEHAPALVEVAITRDAISPDSRSGLINLPDLHAIQPWHDAEARLLPKTAQTDPTTHPMTGPPPVREGETMPVTVHQPADRPRPRGYSEATSGGGVIAIAGQLAADDVLASGGGFVEQFTSALARFREVLDAAGARPHDVLMLRVYVTNVDDYRAEAGELGPAFKEALAGHFPASTLVEVSGLVDERAVVEIEGLATRG